MSQEIKVTAKLKVKKDFLDIPEFGVSSQSVDMAGSVGGVPGIVLAITTGTGTTVDLTGLTTPGFAFFRNLHATALVTIGVIVSGTFHPFGYMKPGEPALFRIDPSGPAAIALKSDTANSPVQVSVFDD